MRIRLFSLFRKRPYLALKTMRRGELRFSGLNPVTGRSRANWRDFLKSFGTRKKGLF
jgi:hypothetical protein